MSSNGSGGGTGGAAVGSLETEVGGVGSAGGMLILGGVGMVSGVSAGELASGAVSALSVGAEYCVGVGKSKTGSVLSSGKSWTFR
jgi:hypothetical protein